MTHRRSGSISSSRPYGRVRKWARPASRMGPPGTGKTKVITLAIGDLLARGKSVLLVSGTNSLTSYALSRWPTPAPPCSATSSRTRRSSPMRCRSPPTRPSNGGSLPPASRTSASRTRIRPPVRPAVSRSTPSTGSVRRSPTWPTGWPTEGCCVPAMRAPRRRSFSSMSTVSEASSPTRGAHQVAPASGGRSAGCWHGRWPRRTRTGSTRRSASSPRTARNVT